MSDTPNDSFIARSDVLQEDYRVDDLLDFGPICEDFRSLLERVHYNSIIGLIGQYGSGKSTMLYQLAKAAPKNEKWIVFDAWKYPERKDLWEGFVLDLAVQTGHIISQIANTIDGKRDTKLKQELEQFFSGITIGAINIGQSIMKLGKPSPATRVFQLQNILLKLINEIDCDFYVIVEDIDRSGDMGIYFLETLRNFVKTNNFTKKITVIVPIGDSNYNERKANDSYTKVLDYHYRFNPKSISFRKLIKAVFDNIALGKSKQSEEQIEQILRVYLMNTRKSIRDVKALLRDTHIRYSRLSADEKSKVDFRVFIIFNMISFNSEKLEMGTLAVDYDHSNYISSPEWIKPILKMISHDIAIVDYQKWEASAPHKLRGDIILDAASFTPKWEQIGFLENTNMGYKLARWYVDYVNKL